ncbi:OmpA family protein [Flavobacterium sp. SUN052]|uniref:OmpA family protein n=1 Tax=Flavobacterium sp. SUN052 TaxID=3002441 RepID=UPI002DB99F4E|nr:OmpA family protein [Flavobacterium sp. SUN052]MEC4005913.1 OmpA family protein [Flavobacterium sp. SUN052]
MKKNRILYLVVACMASMSMFAQPGKSKEAKADKQYDKFAYVDAIKTYERIAAKGYKSQDLLQKLGDSYYFKADLDNAAKWYGELFAFTQDVAPEYYYRYSQSLKAVKDYKKADEMLAKFNEKSGNDLRAKLANSQKDYLAQIKRNSGRYTIENAGINSEYSDYGSAYFGNKVIFASARDTSGLGSRKHAWTGESFTNLYGAEMGDQGALSEAKRFGSNLNSKFHESTPAFTKDGKTVYFTRNNFLDGKKGKDARKTTLLKLYKATLDGDKWSNVTELPFNSSEYSNAHPALSADEKTLYFASNMPGTLGQSDLFKVEIKSDGTYGTPVNLGNTINTEGRETFPMVTSDNELYFASDGHPGLGGLDVFVAKAEADGSYKTVQNVGEPLNSSKDDFAFLINDKTRLGYVTSNREGGQGGDDIYKFKETKKLECEQFLSGVVTDKESGLPLANTKVTLSDANYKMLKETTTDKDGKFDFGQVVCSSKYYIKTEKAEYTTVETPTITADESGKTFVPVELEKSKKPIQPLDDLAKAFGIKLIYFDLDKSFIREDAAVELAKILDVLEQYPNMEIDIRSHTDCRQTAKYNLALSDRRAKSTMAWLISKGIDKSRLTAKGYGESQLVNNCGCEPTNKSDCSEEQHQANRRSEFIITKL